MFRTTHVVNRENLNARPGKNVHMKPAVAKPRPALDEIGNKIGQIQKNHNTKQTLDVKKPVVNKSVVQKKKIVPPSLPSKSLTDKSEAKIEASKKCEKVIAYSTRQLDDVDEQKKGDPLLVTEYVQDIYQ